jgi:hypothetical protein
MEYGFILNLTLKVTKEKREERERGTKKVK